MPKRVLEEFRVEWFQLLDADGKVDASLLPSPDLLTEKKIKRFYEAMVLIRAFDEKALNLQRTGRIGTYASIQGQEAIQAGCAAALQPSDWFFPAFRETGLSILRGYPIEMLYQFWSGDERGGRTPNGIHDFPIAIPVGTHIPHAVGAAWAAQFKKDPIAVLCTFGDGATSKGDFHEGMNFAGVFKLPIVFLCQNNQWAISVPVSHQTASATLAQKAMAYGFKGVQVDGNDVLGIYLKVNEALEKARRGEGPTFVECLTYRLKDHTTADDASRYRSEEEVDRWRKKDPMRRLRTYLETTFAWSATQEKGLQEAVAERIASAVSTFESEPPVDPEEMFDFLFASLTPELTQQKADFKKRLGNKEA
ncbi:MAG: pyruvate dehydrogenase (acetyl-transferring) E1 component subunit alpha [Nitrospiria bacterium]